MEIKLITETNQSSVEAKGTTFVLHATIVRTNNDTVESAYGQLLESDGSNKGSFQFSPENTVNINMYDRSMLADACKDVNAFLDVVTQPKATNLI